MIALLVYIFGHLSSRTTTYWRNVSYEIISLKPIVDGGYPEYPRYITLACNELPMTPLIVIDLLEPLSNVSPQGGTLMHWCRLGTVHRRRGAAETLGGDGFMNFGHILVMYFGRWLLVTTPCQVDVCSPNAGKTMKCFKTTTYFGLIAVLGKLRPVV